MSVVVVGDALLDVDLVGRAGRLMPEAAAPVLDELNERVRAGGAGLAASLLDDAVLVTALADDEDGERLTGALGPTPVVAVPHDGATPVKRRILAGDHAVARLDSGGLGAVGPVPRAVHDALDGADAVLVSDYGQGTVAALLPLLAALPARVPVVWDPHPRGPEPVPGVRLATPNQSEALGFSGQAGSGLRAATAAAMTLLQRWSARAVAVTLGAKGALLSQSGSSPTVVPAPPTVARDTCGAGDRFAGAAAAALAAGALTSEAVEQAVAAASAFVSAGGAAQAGPARAGTLVATGGCFDLLHAGHIATLEAARSLGDRLVVCLNSDASVRRLKGPDRPLVPEADRARVLRALACVDEVVVFSEDTPLEVISALRPDVWVKGGDYAGAELPEAELLASWGGQAVVVPYLSGRSTTRLVETARTRS